MNYKLAYLVEFEDTYIQAVDIDEDYIDEEFYFLKFTSAKAALIKYKSDILKKSKADYQRAKGIKKPI